MTQMIETMMMMIMIRQHDLLTTKYSAIVFDVILLYELVVNQEPDLRSLMVREMVMKEQSSWLSLSSMLLLQIQ